MKAKVREKEMVIALRRKGLTYREILEKIPIAKSSVSLWLKDSPLTNKEKEVLKKRKDNDMTRWRARAGASLTFAKEQRNKIIFKEAKEEFKKNILDPFFQLGISLYWAEGSKRSNCFGFTNSDLEMTKLMIRWVRKYLLISEEDMRMRVYTHKAFQHESHEQWWAKMTEIPAERFGKTVYKSQNGLIVKKRPNYKGCVRIELGKVLYLRKIQYWQQMLIEYYGKQE